MAWNNPAVLATGNSVTAAIWNFNFANMADSGWIPFSTPGYTNGASNAGGPASGGTAAGYRLIGNRVFLGGHINYGTANPWVTLPVGYRPVAQCDFTVITVVTANSPWDLRISSAGACQMYTTGTGTQPGLDGISFAID